MNCFCFLVLRLFYIDLDGQNCAPVGIWTVCSTNCFRYTNFNCHRESVLNGMASSMRWSWGMLNLLRSWERRPGCTDVDSDDSETGSFTSYRGPPRDIANMHVRLKVVVGWVLQYLFVVGGFHCSNISVEQWKKWLFGSLKKGLIRYTVIRPLIIGIFVANYGNPYKHL